MDMYQKRKMRQEKKNNDSQKSFSKVSISWERTTYINSLKTPYFIRLLIKILFTLFNKKLIKIM